MKFYQTKDFLVLNKKWGTRLKKSGFKDIEPLEGGLLPGCLDHNSEFLDPLRAAMKLNYFLYATKFLEDFCFESKMDKKIWALHSEGASQREIVRKLNKKSLFFIHKRLSQMRGIFMDYIKNLEEFDRVD